jgi:hypothetical protein
LAPAIPLARLTNVISPGDADASDTTGGRELTPVKTASTTTSLDDVERFMA